MALAPAMPKMLVVEHDQSLGEFLEALLTEEGYGVASASSLSQALALGAGQVFHGIFTIPFPQGQQDPLLSLEPLRVQTHPTPIVVLSRDFLAEAEAQERGYARVLELPFRIEDVLQVLATSIQRPFSPVLARQAHLIHAYLDALAEEDWARLRQLCLPSVQYVHLTPSPLAPARGLEGVDRLFAYAQAVRQRLPGYHLEQWVVFEQRGHLLARYGCSWQGRSGQRLTLTGSVVFQVAGDRIASIGVTVPWRRMQAQLAETALP